MPYTPPSHRSPASSAPVSPDVSRRPSFHHRQTNTSPRPALPRSTSYLTRHRRTQSAVRPDAKADQPTPEATSEDLKGMVTGLSVRQSPPPVTDERRMPTGAILSPPVSPPESSSDDELSEARGRQIENLKALHDAISQIPQYRSSSPTKTDAKPDAGDLLVLPAQASAIAEGMHQSFSTGSLDGLATGSRRFSHTRSATEPNLVISKSAGNSLTESEEESDEEFLRKPQMVRKKSGELVRPALRPSSRRRPSSMPGTPTFSKAVHFDSHLEHVRHFLQVDRPLAVSAGSSPVDNYDSDTEYPFPGDRSTGRTPPFEWEIVVTNFPAETPARKLLAVRLERVWLSTDQKCLIGSVVVANLAFQKLVTCRFTLDYWKTTSEVTAEYMSEVRPRETPEGHDRFNFTIKLSDLANLEAKTLYFCIRYYVNGQEYWDNNGGTNFQIDFRKKMLQQNGKKGVIGAASRPLNGLPKSNRRSNTAVSGRPKSLGIGMDEFGENANINFDQSIHDYLGESGPTAIRLKSTKSSGSLPSDNLSSRLSSPSGQAFANRYDFGASLTATIRTTKPDGLYMKSHRRPTGATLNLPIPAPKNDSVPAPNPAVTAAAKSSARPPVAPEQPGSPSISSSYEELVNKYCFFGTKSQRFDGGDDGFGTNSTTSSHGSPIQSSSSHHHHGAQHHTLHPRDPNPYFQYSSAALTATDSPTQSPNRTVPGSRTASTLGQPRVPSASSQVTGDSVSPASMAGGLPPFAAIRG
ncbi:putative phosphatase regulatory subunit-domain-containing protein [Coniochaeta sp. 2T2.1]|nr:putative phosphatase regulatory subunit-domain-containing protein [Coniochaeta sp. 2T2.1]